MTLSPDERTKLVSRVQQRLGTRVISSRAIQAVVDQVATAMSPPDESSATDRVVFALNAVSMPDLASRVRHTLQAAGITSFESAAATAGRYTVLTLAGPASLRPTLERIVGELGARLVVLDATASTGLRQ